MSTTRNFLTWINGVLSATAITEALADQRGRTIGVSGCYNRYLYEMPRVLWSTLTFMFHFISSFDPHWYPAKPWTIDCKYRRPRNIVIGSRPNIFTVYVINRTGTCQQSHEVALLSTQYDAPVKNRQPPGAAISSLTTVHKEDSEILLRDYQTSASQSPVKVLGNRALVSVTVYYLLISLHSDRSAQDFRYERREIGKGSRASIIIITCLMTVILL